MLLIQPLFTAALRSDAKRSYLVSYFKQPWQGVFDNRANASVSYLDDAGILVYGRQAGRGRPADLGVLEEVGEEVSACTRN